MSFWHKWMTLSHLIFAITRQKETRLTFTTFYLWFTRLLVFIKLIMLKRYMFCYHHRCVLGDIFFPIKIQKIFFFCLGYQLIWELAARSSVLSSQLWSFYMEANTCCKFISWGCKPVFVGSFFFNWLGFYRPLFSLYVVISTIWEIHNCWVLPENALS